MHTIDPLILIWLVILGTFEAGSSKTQSKQVFSTFTTWFSLFSQLLQMLLNWEAWKMASVLECHRQHDRILPHCRMSNQTVRKMSFSELHKCEPAMPKPFKQTQLSMTYYITLRRKFMKRVRKSISSVLVWWYPETNTITTQNPRIPATQYSKVNTINSLRLQLAY